MKLNRDSLCVGRVLHEDDRFLTIEVMKSDQDKFTLDPEVPDRFLTMLFVKKVGKNSMGVWKPWEA